MPLDNSAEYQNHIPEAVRRQSERSDELARQYGVTGVAPVEAAEEPPAAEPPAPADEVTPATPEATEQQPRAPPEPEVDWEQRYRTLQGKYDAELPQLRGQIDSLERVIAAMNTARPEPTTAEPRHETTVPTVVSADDVETYGQDLIDAVQRWIHPLIERRLAEIESRLNSVSGNQQQLDRRTVQQSVFAALDADTDIGQRWRALDVDPEFVAWLHQVDPFAGEPRMKLLRDACARGDAVRCSAFYKKYIAEHTAITPPTPAPAPPQTAPDEEVAGRPTLESMAAPGRAASSPQISGAPEAKTYWTNREIAAFYRDVQRGRYVGREADKLRIEAEITTAASEGRVRP